MFEKASRLKLRFASPKGLLTTEDLWDIPLTQLDVLTRGLRNQIREGADESFIKPTPTTDDGLQLRFDIAKHIIDVRLADRDKATEAAERADKKRKLLELISRKEDEDLAGRSVDELRKQLEDL